MGSVFTCKLNPCCGDRYNCEPPRQYGETYDDKPAASPQPVAPTGEIAGLRRMSDAHREHAQSAVEHNATLNRLLSIAEARADRLEAEAADLRRKLEEHQDAEDKAAREMATVIQGLRNRATAAERKLEEAREALEVIASSDDIENALDPARALTKREEQDG